MICFQPPRSDQYAPNVNSLMFAAERKLIVARFRTVINWCSAVRLYHKHKQHPSHFQTHSEIKHTPSILYQIDVHKISSKSSN